MKAVWKSTFGFSQIAEPASDRDPQPFPPLPCRLPVEPKDDLGGNQAKRGNITS